MALISCDLRQGWTDEQTRKLAAELLSAPTGAPSYSAAVAWPKCG
jgi:hypothetical protein